MRLDPDLYRAIEEWAQSEMRSVNAQIEFVLRQAARKRFGASRIEGPDDGPPEARD